MKLRRYHAAVWDEPIVLELGAPGRRGAVFDEAEPGVASVVGDPDALVPDGMRRSAPPALPELSEPEVLRHYLHLSQETLGMMGVSLFGTCTMKYNPRLATELAARPEIAELHPDQDDETLQGVLELVHGLDLILRGVSGMDAIVFQAGGGAHAAYTHAVITRAYHAARGELPHRNEMITTIFSHPCDAGTPATAGFKVVTLMPDEKGYPPLDQLKAAVSEHTAGIMMTNPEDTGIYNPNVDKFVEVVHDAGGLAFTDQANANGILGIARARDAGFDACHFNLHKTFSSPHGCEGPAAGMYCCTQELERYLPRPVLTRDGARFRLDYDRPDSIGKIRQFFGNAQVLLKAYAWALQMGPQGLREVAEVSVVNNNYLDRKLLQIRGVSKPYDEKRRLDQVRYSLQQLKEETGIGTHEVQDRMVDFGIQSYWMSHHPFIVPEPFTPEPCETYSREDLDYWAAVIKQASDEAYAEPETVLTAPHSSSIAKMKRTEAFEDPEEWAITWRAYRRKRAAREAAAGK